jgi:uncharacterized protein Yka (UPF0111/DUF47 family)
VSNFHLQEIQTLQNSLREREEYVTELENRLRALWDKYDGDRNHYMDRIKRLEEAGGGMHRYITVTRGLLPECTNDWRKAKEAKL